MTAHTPKSRGRSERGVAIVLAIFTLMLISVVATALILMAGTESAMKGNYKSATHAFYDAMAGLEEGRGRLWTANPTSIANCVFPAPGQTMPMNRVCYVVNPSDGEVVNPLDLSAGNVYADLEYQQEWGIPVTSATVQQPFINSTSAVPSAGIGGPLYKWVRITPRTQASATLAADATDTNPLFYDGMQTLASSGGSPVPNAAQVLTVTALAVTPYGSRRMVQYTVAVPAFAAALASFPSALTLDGNGVSFAGPAGSGDHEGGSGNFQINGNDINAPSGTSSGVSAIGYTNSNDGSSISTAAVPAANYVSPAGVPNLGLVSLPLILQTPRGLDSLVRSITQNADVVLNPPSGSTDQTSLPSMSAVNPMIVVVNGDLHLAHASGSSAFTGYGLLLVTGTLYYDPDDSWNGVILVIGKGVFDGSRAGYNGQINGAVLVANTRDNSGNLLTSLGAASFNLTGGGNGIRYSSNWVKVTQVPKPYQVRSFREIPQLTP